MSKIAQPLTIIAIRSLKPRHYSYSRTKAAKASVCLIQSADLFCVKRLRNAPVAIHQVDS